MNESELKKNQEYITKELPKLLNIYSNKYVLVYQQKVVGSFDTYEAAAEEGVKDYGLNGDFLIQFMTENEPVNFISVA